MTNLMSALFLCLFFVACNKSSSPDCQESTTSNVDAETGSTSCTVGGDTPSITTDPDGSTTGGTAGGSTTGGSSTGGSTTGGSTDGSTLPTEAFTFDTNIYFYKTSSADETKFHKAIEIIKEVVATEEFRSKILNHKYNGKLTFVDNGGYTNAQIYQKILDGAEKLQSTKDNQMDMEVELYYASTSTVGYTYATSKRIWVNTKFFDSYAANSVAANLFHEWLHKVGFGHASSYSTSRDYSVPYAIGSMIRDLGKKFL